MVGLRLGGMVTEQVEDKMLSSGNRKPGYGKRDVCAQCICQESSRVSVGRPHEPLLLAYCFRRNETLVPHGESPGLTERKMLVPVVD